MQCTVVQSTTMRVAGVTIVAHLNLKSKISLKVCFLGLHRPVL